MRPPPEQGTELSDTQDLRLADLARAMLNTQIDGLQHIAANGATSVSRFHYDANSHRLGCLIGTLLQDESDIVWQSMIVDGCDWYVGAAPATGIDSFSSLVETIDQIRWERVTGTGLATSPLSALYWLAGAVAAEEAEQAPLHTSSDGLAWFGVTVSVAKAVDLGGPLELGIHDSFEQAGVTQDLIELDVGLDDGRIAGVLWSDGPDFVADHRFWPSTSQRPVPLPNATEERALADYFVLLGDRNPLIQGRGCTRQ